MLNWKTMVSGKTCLTQRTTYSVSDSVSATEVDDLNGTPRCTSSGMGLATGAALAGAARADSALAGLVSATALN